MKTRTIRDTAGRGAGGTNIIVKILSSDTAVILIALALLLVLIGLSGCAPVPGTASAAAPTASPVVSTPAPAETGLPTLPGGRPLAQITSTPGENALVESAPIVAVAKKALRAKLGISVDGISFVSGEYVEWTTSCLGMEGPREMCLQVITPGYRVVLMAQGTRYEVHTDVSGRTVRIK